MRCRECLTHASRRSREGSVASRRRPRQGSRDTAPAPVSQLSEMSWRFDDKLPEPERRNKPSGWFEVACCATIMVALVGALIALALIR